MSDLSPVIMQFGRKDKFRLKYSDFAPRSPDSAGQVWKWTHATFRAPKDDLFGGAPAAAGDLPFGG